MATDPTTDPSATASPADGPPAGGAGMPEALPEWVTVSRPVAAGAGDRLVSPRRVVAQLLLGVLAAIVLVGVLGSLAAQRLAEREAVNDAATMAGVIAEAVVQPALTDELVAGDPQALAAFDALVRRSVLSDNVVRVKLWTPQGRVVYADEPQLVGETFTLDADQRAALDGPTTVAPLRHERRQQRRLPGPRRPGHPDEVGRSLAPELGRRDLREQRGGRVAVGPVLDHVESRGRGRTVALAKTPAEL